MPLGVFRGLAFAIERHPGGATDVVLTGKTDHATSLAKDSHGPRAVLNALNRICEAMPESITRVESQLTLDEKRLCDFQARIGQAFPHSERLESLTALRDQLRLSLAAPIQEGDQGADAAKAQADLNRQVRECLDTQEVRTPNSPDQQRSQWQQRLPSAEEQQDQIRTR